MKKIEINKRNLKYGSTAVAFTALVVAAVIILNVLVTAFGSAFSWYTDLTGASLYSISDAFRTQLESLADVNYNDDESDDVYFNVVLLMDEDAYRDYATETLYVYRTLKQIEEEYDFINIVSVNSTKDPDFVKSHYMKTGADTPSLTDVIIELAEADGLSRSDIGYKRYTLKSFYATTTSNGSETVIGYNAETRFLSAIAQLTGKVSEDTAPVVYYLQGHGEPTLEKASDWTAIFTDAGYLVREINLLTEDFPEQITKGSLAFINLPKTDLYSTEDGVSEVKKLRTFAASGYGNVIVALDGSTSALPALDNLMSEWGVGMGGTVTDDAHSVAGSGEIKILADYSKTTDNIPLQIVNKIVGSENQTPILFTSPRALYVYDDSKILVPANGSANSAVLLAPYSSAKTSTEIPANAELGVATITTIIGDVNRESATTHYVLCLGSTDFVDKALDTSNANKTLIYYVLDLMWSGSVTFDNVKYKAFDDNALSVTTAATNAWTIICVALIPAALIVAGTVVWIRRRHL